MTGSIKFVKFNDDSRIPLFNEYDTWQDPEKCTHLLETSIPASFRTKGDNSKLVYDKEGKYIACFCAYCGKLTEIIEKPRKKED